MVLMKAIPLFTIITVWVYPCKEEEFGIYSNPPVDEYHCNTVCTVHGFYQFLLSKDVVIGTSTLKCVSSFLNAHIKAEYLACLSMPDLKMDASQT
jgi:hypothetical protein